MKSLLSVGMVLAISSLILVGNIEPLAAQTFAFKLGHFSPSPKSSIATDGDAWFAQEVTKRTNGRVKIEVVWAEGLGKAGELLELTRTGAIDGGPIPAAYFPEQLPFWALPNSIFLHFDSAEIAGKVSKQLAKEFPYFEDEIRRNNLKVLYWHRLLPYHLFGKKKIEKLSDLKGLKVRSFGKSLPVLIKKLGSIPVSILTPDIYEGLDRGVVDYIVADLPQIKGYKFYEVANLFYSPCIGAIASYLICLNLNTWNKLPQDLQKTVLEVADATYDRNLVLVKEAEVESVRWLKNNTKMQFPDLPQDVQQIFKETAPVLRESWIAEMAKKGYADQAKKVVLRLTELTGK